MVEIYGGRHWKEGGTKSGATKAVTGERFVEDGGGLSEVIDSKGKRDCVTRLRGHWESYYRFYNCCQNRDEITIEKLQHIWGDTFPGLRMKT